MKVIHRTDETSFNIESDLLKELGERLVGDAEVALTELIKNSYDADASFCELELHEKSIKVIDDGHGITEEEFKNNWMTVATSNKQKQNKSRLFKRSVTGSKGIGRFAARFLGDNLRLESVAFDAKQGVNVKLTANFDWKNIDREKNLVKHKIMYELDYPVSDPIGTTLTITKLKTNLDEAVLRKVQTGSLGLESPLYNLIKNAPGNMVSLKGGTNVKDKGFSLRVGKNEKDDDTISLSEKILEKFVFKAQITVHKKNFAIEITHFEQKTVFKKTFDHSVDLNTEVFADLYWFPRREGIFRDLDVDGRRAWTWVRANSGVAIFDNGFRIRPYGLDGDDWLQLGHDSSRSERKWRTEWAEQEFPMSAEAFSSPKLNPMLKLSSSHQIVGSVFVGTKPKGAAQSLMPSMDRQGFTENESFLFLRQVVRFAIEAIAHFDKKIQIETEEAERKQKQLDVREELSAVIKSIKSTQTLHEEDKANLVKHYQKVREDVENLESYDRKSRENLEAMSLLGVVAGFMTHEFEAALMELNNAQKIIKSLAKRDSSLKKSSENIENIVQYFEGYINYTRLFVGNLQTTTPVKPFRVIPAIKYVINTFNRFQAERNINVDIDEIDSEIYGPTMPVAIYHGIFHNLYTNAIKALINDSFDDPTIKVLAWNDKSKHYLQVMDNGPGIPKSLQSRIWDPMFTTTSSQDNPLGSGMGLGLSLVKKVVEAQKGKAELIDPPTGFSTCFRISFPIQNR